MLRIDLQGLLKRKGVSQTELSTLSGVRRARINEICSGDVKRLELEHITAICLALNVKPWDWILWDDE